MIYLIHFATPVGRARHYTGITRTERLPVRLRQHGHGNGARLTKRAAREGVAMYLAARVGVDDPSEEKRIKRRGHAKTRCLICRNGLDGNVPPDRFFKLPVLCRGTYRPLEF